MRSKYGQLKDLFLEVGYSPEKNPALPTDDQSGDTSNEEAINKAKVQLFFTKLQRDSGLMSYLNFTAPTEQAQAITAFAELIGVPENQIISLLTSIRRISSQKTGNEQVK